MEVRCGKREAGARDEESYAGGDVRGRSEVKEVQEAKEESGGVAAFFDLDGTLVMGPSLERRFFSLLRYRRAIPLRNYFFWLREAVRLAPRGIGAIWGANKMYLRGVTVDRAETEGLRQEPRFFGDGIKRVAWHARRGHAIVLMSGTLEPLAVEVARSLEAKLAGRELFVAIRVCATRLEKAKGRWTGRIEGEVMNGEAKARAVKKVALEMKLDLESCYAYGDSADDRWMLAAVGRPLAVNPREELARLAEMRGWATLHWREEENGTQRHKGRRVSTGKDDSGFRTHAAEQS
jgi:putative phosphoserine phosphatase/1-acylglycerol-3-phosphate O-acyltransferase